MGVLSRLETTVVEMASRLDEIYRRGLKSWVEELATLHALQVQAQALLDMLLRLAAELGYSPESPGEASRLLLEEGLLTREEHELVRKIIGFRNIVVHQYMDVDMNIVYNILREGGYRRLAILAANLLERASNKGLDP